MPVYIAVEVARRELEGRLLLGLVAAERGYDVVLGKLPHRALLSEELNGWALPPGILHLKSIAATQQVYERFDRLRARGTLITMQDEEHGLSAQSDYADFANSRLPKDGSQRIDRLMAWGALDSGWLRTARPDLAARIIETGSPRIDLWRRDLIESAAPIADEEGIILVVSSMSPFNRNPFWVQLYNMRAGTFGNSLTSPARDWESELYDRWANSYHYVKHLARAVRRLSEANPDRTIVLRPHHFEIPEAWAAVLGDVPNVLVRPDGSARGWARRAAVIIHGGSTLAIEASLAHRPVVAFSPEGFLADSPANRLGMLASSDDELLNHVAAALASASNFTLSARDEDMIAGRIAAIEGRLAADRIVDEWEQMLPPSQSRRVEQISRSFSLVASMRRWARWARDAARARSEASGAARSHQATGKGPYAMEVWHKFPGLDVDVLRADARRLSEHLGRFQDVEIIQIGEREVLLRAAGR